jgi:hypothetical protein
MFHLHVSFRNPNGFFNIKHSQFHVIEVPIDRWSASEGLAQLNTGADSPSQAPARAAKLRRFGGTDWRSILRLYVVFRKGDLSQQMLGVHQTFTSQFCQPKWLCYTPNISNTSSTAQGGGGSIKTRKPIGELGCCESGMAERIH